MVEFLLVLRLVMAPGEQVQQTIHKMDSADHCIEQARTILNMNPHELGVSEISVECIAVRPKPDEPKERS